MRPFLIVLTVLSLAVAGCDSAPKAAQAMSPAVADPGDAAGPTLPIVAEEVLSGWGFRTVSVSKGKQSAWEEREFGKAGVRMQSIKAVKETPGRKDTYYRFTLVEETFACETAARSRFVRLKDNDPELNSKQHPELILRGGFSTGEKVLYVTTDVSAFEIEKLPAMVDLLKAHVSGAKTE